MGERKVLNKYYPPDFDPSVLPRNRRQKNQQVTVRVMLPFSLQCKTCGEYIYRGKKFNARKEEAIGFSYLGIKVWRFYLKCTNCVAELTFRTDPEHADYVCENGAMRNFEPWRQADAVNESIKKDKLDEEVDAMKALENRTKANKREMDEMDKLEELREINARNLNLGTDEVLDAIRQKHAPTDEAARLAAADLDLAIEDPDFEFVRRIEDDDGEDFNFDDEDGPSSSSKSSFFPTDPKSTAATSTLASTTTPDGGDDNSAPTPAKAPLKPLVAVIKPKKEKRKKKDKKDKSEKSSKKARKQEEAPGAPRPPTVSAPPASAAPSTDAAPVALSLLGNYADDSD